jgi:hypothetical protein
MPPIFIPPPRPVVHYRPAPVRAPVRAPVHVPHHHHHPQLPGQPSSNSQPAGLRIQQAQNQARLHEEIVHHFFENLARLLEKLGDALKG